VKVARISNPQRHWGRQCGLKIRTTLDGLEIRPTIRATDVRRSSHA
jgi:hypothetical protein